MANFHRDQAAGQQGRVVAAAPATTNVQRGESFLLVPTYEQQVNNGEAAMVAQTAEPERIAPDAANPCWRKMRETAASDILMSW